MQWLNSFVRGIAIAGVEILRILGEIRSGSQDFFSSNVNNSSVKYSELITAKEKFRLAPWLNISKTLVCLKKWSSVKSHGCLKVNSRTG